MREKLFFGSFRSTCKYAKELRKKMTETEQILWDKIRNRRLERYKFRRQHPVKDYILDFYCLEKSLCIEIDGGIHLNKEQREYDIARTSCLNELGINVIRFSNEQIVNDLERVLKRILFALNK